MEAEIYAGLAFISRISCVKDIPDELVGWVDIQSPYDAFHLPFARHVVSLGRLLGLYTKANCQGVKGFGQHQTCWNPQLAVDQARFSDSGQWRRCAGLAPVESTIPHQPTAATARNTRTLIDHCCQIGDQCRLMSTQGVPVSRSQRSPGRAAADVMPFYSEPDPLRLTPCDKLGNQ